MKPVLLSSVLVLVVACTSEDGPTGPGATAEPSAAAAAVIATNSWSGRAAYPGHVTTEGFLAMAPNAAGQSIVYYLGGRPGSEEEAVDGVRVKAYNVATNTWTTKAAGVEVWGTNGAGRIGSRIYFSGGVAMDDDFRHELWATSEVWAYDFISDRMIPRAGMPIITGDGVSGVIGDKLYVLPGGCSTLFFPDPGSCSRPDTRRFFRYDPVADRWAARPWAPHNHLLGAAGVIDGKFYVVAGVNARAGTGTADLDMYDPETNKWTTLAPIPTGGRSIGAVIGGKLFVIVEPSVGERRSYEYTPGTNVWRSRPAPAFTHDGVVRVTVGDTTYLLAAGRANPSELYTR
jgi:hypothetical protein